MKKQKTESELVVEQEATGSNFSNGIDRVTEQSSIIEGLEKELENASQDILALKAELSQLRQELTQANKKIIGLNDTNRHISATLESIRKSQTR